MQRPLEGSDSDALGEEFAMVGGVSEKQLRALCPLEVEMCGVFPRKPDAAVNLDVFGGGVEICF